MPSLRRGRGAALTRANLGAGYHKLWTAAAISNLGDGIFLTALPLLAATLTRDPLQVSAVFAAGWLPWLLLGLLSGALADRWDRRQMMWIVDAARFAVVGALGVAVIAGWASIPLLIGAAFLLGVGQTLFDSAAQSLIPALVGRDPQRLERANGQLFGAQQVTQQLAGPPFGGFLFALTRSLPLLDDAVSFAASSALIAAIPGRFGPERATDAPPTTLRAEITVGLRWLLGHRLLRTGVILGGIANLALTAMDAILVLFAQERLGLDSLGYGLLLASYAVGGSLASLAAVHVGRLLGSGTVIEGSILVAAAMSLGIGLTASPLVAGGLLAVEGAALTIHNVVGVSLRQAIVPDALMGRVAATSMLVDFGTIPIGGVLGGVAARALGLRSPFLLGAAVLVVAVLLTLPAINNRTVHAARIAAAATPPPGDAWLLRCLADRSRGTAARR
jgi:predicted MFS family arabinose efflux permease